MTVQERHPRCPQRIETLHLPLPEQSGKAMSHSLHHSVTPLHQAYPIQRKGGLCHPSLLSFQMEGSKGRDRILGTYPSSGSNDFSGGQGDCPHPFSEEDIS